MSILYSLIRSGKIKVNRNSPPLHRFWAGVNKLGPLHPILETRCWLWTKRITTGGYGQIIALGEMTSHRVSYRLLVGEIPEGLLVLHKCDNRTCVNPAHLWLGTNQDNSSDMVSKGRAASGERHVSSIYPGIFQGEKNGSAKLKEVDVKEIRRLFSQGISRTAIAKLYAISYSHTDEIVKGRKWKHCL